MTTRATRTRHLTDTGRALIGLTVPVLAVLLVVSIVATPAAVPKFRIVARQGAILSIVVDERVAANDGALFKIADSLIPTTTGRAVQLQVWTDPRMVPERILDATDAQLAARRALVTVNTITGFRKVESRQLPPAETDKRGTRR
jgi:hypothetical protein